MLTNIEETINEIEIYCVINGLTAQQCLEYIEECFKE